MSNEELTIGFDILYNNVSSNKAPGLSVYEKSFFLTSAQDLILKAYLSPKTNKVLEGFDASSERNLDFSNLTTTKFISLETSKEDKPTLSTKRIINRPPTIIKTGESTDEEDTKKETEDFTIKDIFNSLLPENDNWHKIVTLNTESTVEEDSILAIINEVVIAERNGVKLYLQCIPITYDDYTLSQSRVYKFPNRKLAWRLINNGYKGSKYIELIAGFNDTITGYLIKYVRKPRPIVLTDLDGQLSIDGCNKKSSCELDPIIHKDILQRAVELAKAAYMSGSFNDLVATGLTSSTNLGIIPTRGSNE